MGAQHFQGITVQPMEKLTGYELILGSSIDPQFGPVLLFGSGGVLVEVIKDRALALPPLNTTLARRLMEQTRIFEALQGIRGRQSVKLEALERLLVRFSQLVVEQPWIKEVDINPLLASPERLVALDARIVLHDPTLRPEDRPRPAIRPYPERYVAPWTALDGTGLLIRPIRPEDEPGMSEFHQAISANSLYLRYFHPVSPRGLTAHDQLVRSCFIDYDREIALVAEQQGEKGGCTILAWGQLIKLHGSNEAEFAILVCDQFQQRGLGTELLRRLIEIGRDEGLDHIVAEILPENKGMQCVCSKLGFSLSHDRQNGVIHAKLAL
jgi:acetyltransferase